MFCANRETYVADLDGKIVGFAVLESDGYLNCFYCHKNYQRCGAGRRLYDVLEAQAIASNIPRLFTEASITAKPFFESMGFVLMSEQTVSCLGETLINYVMEKWLSHQIESEGDRRTTINRRQTLYNPMKKNP